MDNKELQSRRDFFKKSLHTVLPIIGTIVLGPSLLTSCSKEDEEDDDYSVEVVGQVEDALLALAVAVQVVRAGAEPPQNTLRQDVMEVVRMLVQVAVLYVTEVLNK